MSERKSADFHYGTGEKRVPWAEVGEHYNAGDVVALVKFLIQKADGGDSSYDAILSAIESNIGDLAKHGTPPGKLSLGENVSKLEERVNRFLECRHSIFITNATAGFEIGYRYANLRPGDEVIAPAITFIATISYPLAIGAKVVFADLDQRTINMDPADVERRITDRTRVIIPVHIGGWPVDMDPIMTLAEKHNLIVIEDAAHAFGSVYKGKKVGTIGDFGSYSFHEVKNITSFGEGGILTTSSEGFGKDLKKARFLGLDPSKKIPNWVYDVIALKGKYGPFAANNSSATEIQAIGLLHQLDRIDAIKGARRAAAMYLTGRFAENEAIIPQLLDSDDMQSTYHLYLLQIEPEKAGGTVQDLKKKLEERGVANVPHFAPLYKFQILKDLGYDATSIERSCPVAEDLFNNRFTHLPLYGLTKGQLEYMADSVLESVYELQKGL
jgi:dTDP-4-amino-4,6-dideoxygalactose transaminase